MQSIFGFLQCLSICQNPLGTMFWPTRVQTPSVVQCLGLVLLRSRAAEHRLQEMEKHVKRHLQKASNCLPPCSSTVFRVWRGLDFMSAQKARLPVSPIIRVLLLFACPEGMISLWLYWMPGIFFRFLCIITRPALQNHVSWGSWSSRKTCCWAIPKDT